MPKETHPVMPSIKTWNAILKLAQQGQDCEKQIDDLEAARAEVLGKLTEMGMGSQTKQTVEWKNTAAAFAEVELTLKSERSSLKLLARQSNKLITGAAQGKVFEDKEIDDILDDDGTAPLPLYDDAMRSAQAVGAGKQVGEPDDVASKREKAKGDPLGIEVPAGKASKPDAEWQGLKLAETPGVTIGGARACEEVGLITLGHAERFVFSDGLKLKTIDGLSPREQKAIADALAKFRGNGDAKPKGKGARKAVVA